MYSCLFFSSCRVGCSGIWVGVWWDIILNVGMDKIVGKEEDGNFKEGLCKFRIFVWEICLKNIFEFKKFIVNWDYCWWDCWWEFWDYKW